MTEESGQMENGVVDLSSDSKELIDLFCRSDRFSKPVYKELWVMLKLT